ncbi:DUF6261 family protein [Aquimarina sediminis]|uniref:DUF6261 family protein n=1 Tax=Aquimarina sediminis TaxID=2070536 RepID=UPI000CA05932|nr:DUF6261 family protein [Aquimarina sediminis]
MSTIKTALTVKYRNGEMIQFLDDILILTQKRGPVHPKLVTKYDKLHTATRNAFNAFEPSRKLINTEVLIATDKERDELTVGLRATLLGLSKHPDIVHQKAAKLLLEKLDSYGRRVYRLNFQLQTHVTRGFLDAVKNEPALDTAADTLLVVKVFLDALQSANDQFADQYLMRTQEKGQHIEAEMETLIKEAEIAYREFITRLNAIVEIDESGNYDNLVRDINASIDQYNQVVLDRRGVRSIEPDDEEEDIIDQLIVE